MPTFDLAPVNHRLQKFGRRRRVVGRIEQDTALLGSRLLHFCNQGQRTASDQILGVWSPGDSKRQQIAFRFALEVLDAQKHQARALGVTP